MIVPTPIPIIATVSKSRIRYDCVDTTFHCASVISNVRVHSRSESIPSASSNILTVDHVLDPTINPVFAHHVLNHENVH